MSNYENLQGKRLGFIGFGDIAEKAVKELQRCMPDNMPEVLAYRRNPNKIGLLLPNEQAIYLDVTQTDSLNVLTEVEVDYWVVTLTPAALSEADYRATYVVGLKNILQILQSTSFKKLFWVSSSSVYGQANDEWVDETSETVPQRLSGQVQLEAEQVLAMIAQRACVVRFSGIYREHQHRMVESLRQQKLPASCEADYYTNRIHVIDAARSLLHLMAYHAGGKKIDKMYLASDSSPVKYMQLVQWLSEQYQLPLNDTLPAAKQRINSKRCSNKRLKDTGFEFKYDTYQTGFASYF